MKRNQLSKIVPCAGLLGLIALGSIHWPPTLSQSAQAAESRNGDVTVVNQGKTTWDDKRSLGRMLTNVRVTQDGEDFILHCDELLYNTTTNQAIAKGKMRVESRDSTITGTEIRADFNTKVITITGNVEMRSHGTDDGMKTPEPKKGEPKVPLREGLKRKASRMTCDRIDYNYRNKQAAISGNIRMVQGKNVGTCERIAFDEDKNVAVLTSSTPYGVKFTDAKARTILTKEVEVFIDDEQTQTKYPVQIVIPRPQDGTAATTAVVAPPVEFPGITPIPENPFGDAPPTTETGEKATPSATVKAPQDKAGAADG